MNRRKTEVAVFRDRHGLTQARLAGYLGVRVQQIQKWEYGTDQTSTPARAAFRYLDAILGALNAKRLPNEVRQQLQSALVTSE